MTAIVYAFFTMRGPHGVPAYLKSARRSRNGRAERALARENQLKREYIERLGENQAEQEIEIRRR